jgi:PPK2 family polyphosphate:nucleotide phosphotransferase
MRSWRTAGIESTRSGSRPSLYVPPASSYPAAAFCDALLGMERKRWVVEPGGALDLRTSPTRSTEGAPGDKAETKAASDELRVRLAELQDRLYAEDERSLLLVLQAMDAGGKDGAIKKVFSGVNPQSCRVTSFKQPSAEELEHDFLWRISKALPARGEVGIFNRSHYEDVGVVRVKKLVPERTIKERYEIINSFEHALTVAGTRIVKVFLHISKEEQAERLRARLDDPSKRWKFRAEDLDDRALWDEFMGAYGRAISATSTEDAPWYVIPADRKWYRDWSLLSILVETLTDMDPRFPDPVPDIEKLEIT